MSTFEIFDTEVDLSTPVDIQQIKPDKNESEETNKEKRKEGLLKDGDLNILDINDPAFKEKGGDDDDEIIEQEVEKKDVKKDKTPSDKDADSSSPYSTYAKALFEEGVLTSYDDKEFKELTEELGSESKALIELVQRTIDEQVAEKESRFTPEQQDLIDAIGKGVPLDKYIAAKSQDIKYSSINADDLDDDEDACKELITQDLHLRGFDKEEIEEKLKDLDSLGKITGEGKKALSKLQKYQAEETKRLKAEGEQRMRSQQEENKKLLVTLKKDIDAITEIIPGVKINAQQKTKIYEALTTPAMQTDSGQYLNPIYAKRAENPKEFDIRLAYLFNSGVFDGNWDKILNKSKTSAINQLEEKLKGGSVAKSGEMRIEGSEKSKEILDSMRRSFLSKSN